MSENFIFLLLKNFSHIAFSCAIEPLRIANDLSKQPLYNWKLISENGISQICSNKSVTLVDSSLEPLKRNDCLFVISGSNVAEHTSTKVLNYIRKAKRHGVLTGGMCTGAYVLAKAGLLDGKKCSVHWQYHTLFKEIFPQVHLEESIFVHDLGTPTAAGGLASADLMLHLISQAHGARFAAKIADQLVYNRVRTSTETQRLSHGAIIGARNTSLTKAIQLMELNQETVIPIKDIASEIGISVRQIERLFKKHLNKSPVMYYKELRLIKARNLLLITEMSIADVGYSCGFQSQSAFSKSYKKMFGHSAYKESGFRVAKQSNPFI